MFYGMTERPSLLGGLRRFHGQERREDGHMRRQVAVSACRPMTDAALMRVGVIVIAVCLQPGRCGAIYAQHGLEARVCGECLRDRRRERGHQDCKQSDDAAEFSEEATAHGVTAYRK